MEIAGGKALAASGDFDTLNSSIEKLADDEFQETINRARQLLEGKYGEALAGKELLNASAVEDYSAVLGEALDYEVKQKIPGAEGRAGYAATSQSNVSDILKRHEIGPDATYIDAIREANAAIEELDERQQQFKERLDSGDIDQTIYDDVIADIEDARRSLNAFLASDEIQAAEQAAQTMFDNRVQMSDFQQDLADAETDIQAMMNVFANDTDTQKYFTEATSGIERLKLMLSATTDEAQQLSIQFAINAEETASQLERMQFKENPGISKEEVQANIQDIYNQISDLNLNTEQASTLLIKISHEDSIEAINEGLARIRESGNIDDFEIPVKLNEEELKEQVQNSIDSYSEESFDSDVDIETAQAFADYLSKNDVEGYSEELHANAEALKEVVEEQGRYDAALEKCQKSYED